VQKSILTLKVDFDFKKILKKKKKPSSSPYVLLHICMCVVLGPPSPLNYHVPTITSTARGPLSRSLVHYFRSASNALYAASTFPNPPPTHHRRTELHLPRTMRYTMRTRQLKYVSTADSYKHQLDRTLREDWLTKRKKTTTNYFQLFSGIFNFFQLFSAFFNYFQLF
jgi:hypothetical protein